MQIVSYCRIFFCSFQKCAYFGCRSIKNIRNLCIFFNSTFFFFSSIHHNSYRGQRFYDVLCSKWVLLSPPFAWQITCNSRCTHKCIYIERERKKGEKHLVNTNVYSTIKTNWFKPRCRRYYSMV